MMYGTAYRTELRQDIYLSGENGAYCELGDITWNKNQASHNFSFNASLLDGFQLQGYSIQYAKKEDGHTYLYYDTQIEAGYSEYCIGYGFRFEYLIQDNKYVLNTVSFMNYNDE